MSLSFNPNTPGASDIVAVTQPLIQTNFQSLNSAFNAPAGGVTGGGNFTSYSLQNTITSFTAKPTNPVGVLYTLASSGGNPELAWINNVNSQGAGPFTGTQLTGGGVTSAAWSLFNANGGVVTVNAQYNIASITQAGANGAVTITFTRAFASVNYAALITITGFNDTTIRKVNITSQSTTQIVFRIVTSSAQVDPGTCNLACFGILS